MATVLLATYAMRTRFEFVLVGDEKPFLRAVGEEALREVEELERLLSRFRADSDISRINRQGARQPVRVDARTFRLLQRALLLSHQTEGAFDITVGGWWRERGQPTEEKPPIGAHLVSLDEESQSVRLLQEGVQLDLGGIGKGYALERAAALLQGAGVANAFLHGGTSSAFAFGCDEEGKLWRVAVRHPTSDQILAIVALDRCGFSVSANDPTRSTRPTVHPRTGEAVTGALLAAVVLPSPTDAEAWSTALLVLGAEGLQLFHQQHPDCWALIVTADGQVKSTGQPNGLSLCASTD